MQVVVIGCGLAGVTTAWFLHRAGAEVTVVDRAPAPARETSFANGSMLTPSLADPWNAPGVFSQLVRSLGDPSAPMLLHLDQLPRLGAWGLRFLLNARRPRFEESYLHNVRLAQYSQQIMAEIQAASEPTFEFADLGILKVFESAESLEEAEKVGHWLKQVGVEHETLNLPALLALEPALGPGSDRLAGGILYPGDEVGNARMFCEALSAELAAEGVRFRFSEQVLDFQTRGRRIQSLRLPSGTLAGDSFVLAAGSFSRALGRKLKLNVPVVPAKGYSITVPVAQGLPLRPVVDDAMHAAVVPLGGNRLRVAGTAEFAGFDQTVRPARIDNLVRLLGRIYPQVVVDAAKLEAWAGLRPMTADGRPILGPTKIENLFLNTGHGALGWTLACGSGKVVAELVLGAPASYDPSPFLAGRF